MKDLIVVAILVVVIGLAVGYMIKAKKNGVKCIGCPSGGNCGSSKKEENTCSCGCCDCQTKSE